MITINNISPEALANLPQADPFSLFIEGLALPVMVISGVMLIIGFFLYNWPHSEKTERRTEIMEHNKVLGKGRLDNYLSWMGLGIVTAGLAVTIVQSYCTITSYYELGIVLLATGVAAVIIGGIWCGEESERDVVED